MKGKLDGKASFFDDDGYLYKEQNYKNGILVSEYSYKLGTLNGPEKYILLMGRSGLKESMLMADPGR